MRKGFIIGIIVLVVVIILGLIIFSDKKPEILGKPTLYTLDKPINKKFTNAHPYLEGLQQVSYWGGENVIAKTNKPLDKASFITLVNELVDNGYVRKGGFNQIMEIKEREVIEQSDDITIIDKGVNTVVNDAPPYGTTYMDIILEYRYDKNNHNIYFKPS